MDSAETITSLERDDSFIMISTPRAFGFPVDPPFFPAGFHTQNTDSTFTDLMDITVVIQY